MVSGVITEDRKLNEAIDKLADNAERQGADCLDRQSRRQRGRRRGPARCHRRVAAKKPVVAVMGGMAASAGYMISVPAARIFAREATLTGSIGVLLETGDMSGLLGKLGINSEPIVSGPLKDQPSYTRPLSPEGRQVLQGLVMDMYDQFVTMVAQGRHMDADRVRTLADGRPYTGRQALKLGLVDQIGGEHAAREWLAKEKGVSSSLPTEDLTTGGLTSRVLSSSLSWIIDSLCQRRSHTCRCSRQQSSKSRPN